MKKVITILFGAFALMGASESANAVTINCNTSNCEIHYRDLNSSGDAFMHTIKKGFSTGHYTCNNGTFGRDPHQNVIKGCFFENRMIAEENQDFDVKAGAPSCSCPPGYWPSGLHRERVCEHAVSSSAGFGDYKDGDGVHGMWHGNIVVADQKPGQNCPAGYNMSGYYPGLCEHAVGDAPGFPNYKWGDSGHHAIWGGKLLIADQKPTGGCPNGTTPSGYFPGKCEHNASTPAGFPNHVYNDGIHAIFQGMFYLADQPCQ